MNNPPSLKNIPQLLQRYNVHPKRGLGQNFLVDDLAAQQIVKYAALNKDDIILEIGPGLGNITRLLSLVARSVIAVELDGRLIPILNSLLEPYKNIQLIHSDILKVDIGKVVEGREYLVVANIPYNITSILIRHLLESNHQPRRLVLTIQKEVAERICTGPGKMSILALSVQVYGKPQLQAVLPNRSFYPPPKVDSAILTVDMYPKSIIPSQLMDTFFRLVKSGFSQKRKTLRNSLSAGLKMSPGEVEKKLAHSGIDPMRRAETLDFNEWEKLCRAFQ